MKARVCLVLLCIAISICCGGSIRNFESKSKVLKGKRDLLVSKGLDSAFSSAKVAAIRGGINGSFAACLQVLSLMWIRTIISYQYRFGVSFSQAMHELYSQGGILRFYEGLSYAIVQGPLSKFGIIAAHEGSRTLMKHLKLMKPIYTSLLVTFLTVSWRVFLMPLETCKTVLQVQGSSGFRKMMKEVVRGRVSLLYEGSAAVVLLTFVSHYPWFFVHDWLESYVPKPTETKKILLRTASISFVATLVSDVCSNCLRIIKTMKQTALSSNQLIPGPSDGSISYVEAIQRIYSENGVLGLFGRGLLTRVLANGLQTVIFTFIWKLLQLKSEQKDKQREEQEEEEVEEELALQL